MSLEDVEGKLRGVDWASLNGAYGASDGSAHRLSTLHDGTLVKTVLGDVPHALSTLAREGDTSSDEWADAMDVLYSHVTHQGDLYEVTPYVVPFLFELVTLEQILAPRRKELAGYLVSLAASAARYRSGKDEAERELGARVHRALEEQLGPMLARWLDGELEREGVLLAMYTPGLRAPALEALERRAALPFFVWLAATLLDDAPPWLRARAMTSLNSEDALERLAAAAFLAQRPELAESSLSRLEQILVPTAAATLEAAIDLPFELSIPTVRGPFEGALSAATVLFAGPKLVVVKTEAGHNLTLHWTDAGLTKGDAVHVGVSPQGAPRVVEWTGSSGQHERIEFG